MTDKNALDLNSFEYLLNRYCNWLIVNNYSERTAKRMRYTITQLIPWCSSVGIDYPKEFNKSAAESYKRYLASRRSNKDGKKLKASYIRGVLTYIRMFFRWCVKQGFLEINPMGDFELPKRDKTIIRTVLDPLDVEKVLNQIDTVTNAGLRDRALLECLYSTGIRRMEARGLDISDLDMDRGLLLIRLGKGRKDRLIPIGDRAIAWIDKYLIEIRPSWAPIADHGSMFITRFGTRLTERMISKIVRQRFKDAGIEKGGAHVFRHSMATSMLNAGADIRHIQEMLGHECIQSTQIYTKVSVAKLKEIHTLKHPARLDRKA
jgi:integrase/recombinase XerD